MANSKVKSKSTKKTHNPGNEIKKESISNYQFVLNNLESGYANQKIILDKKGKPIDFEYIDVNPAFEKLMGLKAINIIGKKITEVIPNFKKKKIDWIKFYGEVALTGKNKSCDFYSDSIKRWLHINSHSPKKGYFITEFHDITLRKQNEEELLNLNRTYAFISQINQMIVRENRLDEIFRKVCEIAVKFGKFQMAWIGLLDEKTQEVKPVTWSGVEDGYLSKIKISLKNGPDGIGPTAKSIKEGTHFYCNDIENDPAMFQWSEEALSRGYRSSIALPIKLRENIFGALSLYSKFPNYFDEQEVRLLNDVSDDISYAIEKIENEKIRRHAEDALKESERFMASIVENIPNMIFIKDAQDLKFIRINKAGENLLGYKMEDLVGKNDFDFFPKEQADAFTKNDIDVLKSGKQFNSPEEHIETKMGKRILYTKKIPIFNKNGEPAYLLGISEDITERKLAEEKIKESEIRYRAIFENTGTATVIIDEDTIISLANTKFEELSGYSKNEIEHKISWKDFVVKEDLEIMSERHKSRRADESKAVKSYEFRFTDKSGKIKDILLTIDVIPGTKKSVASLLDITERKSAENKLRESEKRYRFLFEHNPVPMLIYERITFQLFAVNEAFLKHYGYNKEQILSMTLPDLYPDEQKNLIIDLANKLHGHAYAGEWKHRKADGTLIDILATSHDINFKNKDCRIAVINDITERKKTERALRESEEKYRTLINASTDGILIIKDEIIQFVNNVLEDMSGFSEKDLIGQPFINFVTINDREKVKQNYAKRINGDNAPFSYEINANLKNGLELPIEITSSAFKLFGNKAELVFVRDITERKEAEKEILQNRQELDSIYNTVGDIIFLIQVEDGSKFRFSSVNKTFLNVTGLDSSMVVGKLINEVIPEPSLTLVKQNYQNIIHQKKIERWEETTEYPSGKRTGEVSVAPVFDLEGKCTHLVGSVHDITERKLVEEKISKLNLELEDRVKIRTKQLEDTNNELEAFAYSVSHDLRAPLRAITGFSKLLVEEYYDKINEEGKEYLDDIISNSQRMANLIDDLLELSRYGRKRMEKSKINMKELFKSIFEEEKEHAKNESIILNMSDFPDAVGDYSLMKQVAINLISNAVKYSSKNPKPVIEFGSNTTDKEIVYYVKDNGVGFNMKYVHKLFGVFQRLHNLEEYEGTGVGLAIVQRIINKHNGRVWAESEQGKGAVFYFALPRD